MSATLTWSPSPEPEVYSYVLESAPTSTGLWTHVITILAAQTGPNWDPTGNQYIYDDLDGTSATWYHIYSIDNTGEHSDPSSPFRPSSSAPTVSSTVRVDQNYPAPGNLRYQTYAGVPIEMATIRVYKESDYLGGFTDHPLATVLTDAAGGWVSPVYLLTGYNYVVEFWRVGLYGPDRVTITV